MECEKDFIKVWQNLRQEYDYCTAIMKILNLINQEEQDKTVREAIESLKCTARSDMERFYQGLWDYLEKKIGNYQIIQKNG